MKLGYLVSRYPAVTHTFILREARGLRKLGIDVHTISIARVGPEELLSDADREEASTTFNVRPVGPLALGWAHLSAFGRSPGAYVRTMRRALALSPSGARATLWQLFYFVQAMRVWHQCRRRGIRHLHVHFANVSADVAMLVAEFGGEGWTWSFTMHGPTEFSDVEAHRLRQKAEDAEFVACISDYARSQLLAIADPGRWHRFVVARLGVVPQEPRTRPGGEPPNFLVVGQLARRKGHDVLLHALARLRHEARLTIVGDGPERERLERLASELGVRDRVSFEGARGQHELRGYYEAADVFCLPSFQEGLPVVLMEAMAFGVPVVATRIMGVPELVDDGVSGVLVTAARVDELATALDELLDDPARAEAIGRVGRERVRREYDLEANVGRLSELLTRADAEAAR